MYVYILYVWDNEPEMQMNNIITHPRTCTVLMTISRWIWVSRQPHWQCVEGSFFNGWDALSLTQPTASKHW